MSRKARPTRDKELSLKSNYGVICGIDECGCGSLAGPVIAAAVTLSSTFNLGELHSLIRDSKRLTQHQRERVAEALLESKDCTIGIGEASHLEVDTLNIRNATFLAHARAVEDLERLVHVDMILLDGSETGFTTRPCVTIVSGDETELSIAAASIVAKYFRDHCMFIAHLIHPGYGFDGHFGYGTPAHTDIINQGRFCEYHRKSFNPLRSFLLAHTPTTLPFRQRRPQ